MGEIKVSVIVPVYNAAAFLEKNLLILSKQTLEEIEFICVNDKSTDNSLNILKAFKDVFPDKFVVIDSDRNRGPGGARNIGLSYARGKYIGFMDCDDCVHPDMYKSLYDEAVLGDFDIVKCSYYDKMNSGIAVLCNIKGELDDPQKRLIYAKDGTVIWNKIYKKTLIDEMSMGFRENAVGEDIDFNLEAVLRAKKVSALPNAYYYYNFEGESISRSKTVNLEKDYLSAENIFESIESRSKSTPNYSVGLEMKKYVIAAYIKRIMYELFIKPDFSLKDFERFDKFARKYSPEYYKIKNYDTFYFEEMIFNNLTENPKESYLSLIRFREKIESGELDKEIAEKKKNSK